MSYDCYSVDRLMSLENTPVLFESQEVFSIWIDDELGALTFLVLAKKD